MNLLAMLANANGGRNIEALANRFGLSGEQTQSVLGQLLPALSQGVQNNASSEGGFDSLLGALSGDRHDKYIDKPESLNGAGAVEEGNGILGHILGGKDASRSLARQVAGSTGISDTIIRQMLPVVASLAMGAMSKKMGSNPSANLTGSAQGLAGMLDFNGNGSSADDIMGLVGRFLKR